MEDSSTVQPEVGLGTCAAAQPIAEGRACEMTQAVSSHAAATLNGFALDHAENVVVLDVAGSSPVVRRFPNFWAPSRCRGLTRPSGPARDTRAASRRSICETHA